MTELIPLTINMASCAYEYINKIKPSQVPVLKFKELVGAIPYKGIVDEFNAPEIVMKCLDLINKTNEYEQVCKAMSLEAKRQAGQCYAQARLYSVAHDEAMKGISLTAGTRQDYAEMNGDYLKYQDLDNAWSALANYFSRLHDDMTNNYYFYKKIFEYQKKIEGIGN